MRIVVTGATGNLGTSLLAALARDPEVESVLGVARRIPTLTFPRTSFVAADVGRDSLEPVFRDADAVVHLAWQLQPSHRPDLLERTNVDGSARVFQAASRAGVPTLIYASSIGAYTGGSKEHPVDEAWPTEGVPSSLYSRHKARVEALLDDVEGHTPSMRVVRMRPAFLLKRDAASDIRRLYVGPLVPRFAFDHRLLRAVPDHPRLRLQGMHTDDAAEAFRLALHRDVRGAFNVAADPILDGPTMARRLGATPVRATPALLRGVVGAAWRLHLVPTAPGWVDLAFAVPLVDSARADHELDWRPVHRADDAFHELVEGLREGAGLDTPPLAPRRGLALTARADPQSLRGRLLRPSEAQP